MDRATAKVECLKLAVARRTGGDTPAALVAVAREFEAYVLEEFSSTSDTPAEAGPGRSRESSAADTGRTREEGSGSGRAPRPVNRHS